MIGVISTEKETRAAKEFFELFKTPWEFFVAHHCYDVVIATSGDIPKNLKARLLIVYGSQGTDFDEEIGIEIRSRQRYAWLEWDELKVPIYAESCTFAMAGKTCLSQLGSSQIVAFTLERQNCRTVRIGYSLFLEVSYLLSKGQPSENARIPSLEIHIALLRKCLLDAGISFVEVPPVPADYEFMACLTHDVDFIGIRQHKFDHTMWGFIYRACVGSLFAAWRKRLAWSNCLQNWKAVLSLPFVHLGLVDDFWLEFDRYREIEKGLGSTFFFIPFKNCPGTHGTGPAPKRRAAKYDLGEIKEQVVGLVEHGCEVGLHGVDAWHDLQSAQAELIRLREASTQSDLGVRMHWLYFSEASPKALDEAGFSYDSTCGYNDAVGFRAGTSQVFRPLTAKHILEIPLAIQDTALFYPSRMDLSEAKALDMCKQLIDYAAAFGGVLTLNWHTRSLSPERLWGAFYVGLLNLIQTKRVWFATAREIAAWFRIRRGLRFEQVRLTENGAYVRLSGPMPKHEPGFLVRFHRPGFTLPTDSIFPRSRSAHSDTSSVGETELQIAS